MTEDFDEWKDKILDMCKRLSISDVSFQITNNSTIKLGESLRDTSGKYIVYINMSQIYSLCNLRNKHDAVIFLLAHELAHVYNKDSDDYTKRITSGVAFSLLYFPILILSIALFYNLTIPSFVLLAFFAHLFLMCIVSITICDSKFWSQILEFRADRIGFSVSGVPFNSFLDFANSAKILTSESSKYENLDDLDVETHPFWDTRIRELFKNHYRYWSVVDLLSYIFRYTFNRIFKRNWRF